MLIPQLTPKNNAGIPVQKSPPNKWSTDQLQYLLSIPMDFTVIWQSTPPKLSPPKKKKSIESVHKNPVACCPCVNSLFTVINLKRTVAGQWNTKESTHSSPERVERLIITGTLKLTTSSPLKGWSWKKILSFLFGASKQGRPNFQGRTRCHVSFRDRYLADFTWRFKPIKDMSWWGLMSTRNLHTLHT